MTTAAPPEKMTHGMNCSYHDPEIGCTCCLAERIALSTEQTMHRAWRKRAEEAEAELQAARRLAPRVGDREPTEAMLIAARDWSARVFGKPIGNAAAIGCWQIMWDAALSAPPAASADEVELEAHILTFFPDNPHSAKACALTYRKRQGVAEALEEVAQWCEGRRQMLMSLSGPGVAHERETYRATAAHIRRLSALPKGQEHEG